MACVLVSLDSIYATFDTVFDLCGPGSKGPYCRTQLTVIVKGNGEGRVIESYSSSMLLLRHYYFSVQLLSE